MNLFRFVVAPMLAALLAAGSLPAHATDGKMSAAPAPEQVTPSLARELTGTYRFEPGHEITLAPFDEFGGSLVMIDLKTLEQRILFLQPDGSFAVGTTTLNPTPLQATLRFSAHGGGRLGWKPADGSPTRIAERVYPTRHEDVVFRNGDVELHGTLSIPEGPGPHPAVVLVHGSGAATRNIGFFASVYERLGIATLSFDKRGAGESTGNWKSAPFTDLAGDVLAAVALLKARDDIDGSRIGLDGSSQGGWVGAMAASMSPDVAWLQVRVGSGVSVLENMLWEDIDAMRQEGLDDAQAQEVVAFDREIYGIYMRGGTRADGEAAAKKYASRAWFAKLYPDGFKASEYGHAWMRANGAVESVDSLRKLKIPVNWYFGANDGNVPTARSAPRVVQALIDAGNPDFSVTVLPSDHSFLADVPASGDKSQVTRYVPGFLEANAAWLRARGFAEF
jgi:pimeloyl-ACP methyl ester carboxylesterase